MKWDELKKQVIAEYDRRNLATNRRNSSINRIEKYIKSNFQAMDPIELLLQTDKENFNKQYKDFLGVDKLNSADYSCINEIYNQLNNLKLSNE